jgi:hypothetical protein
MVRSSDSVSIGNGPDFTMRLGADELSHTFSFVVNRPRSVKSSLIPSGVSSDKSLATAVEILKQKLAPYGWHNSIQVTWSSDVGFKGTFRSHGRDVVFEYRFHERLESGQRVYMTKNIGEIFIVK